MLVADAVEPLLCRNCRWFKCDFRKIISELMMGVYNNAVAVGGSSRLRGLKRKSFR